VPLTLRHIAERIPAWYIDLEALSLIACDGQHRRQYIRRFARAGADILKLFHYRWNSL
jgi:hypothetical protein